MKNLLKKIIQRSIVILISWIAVCGIVYVQQPCCSTTVDACSPVDIRLSDCDVGNACCKPDRCDKYNRGTYSNPSLPQYVYPFQKNVGSFQISDGKQIAFETSNLSTSLKSVPIYILIQSLII